MLIRNWLRAFRQGHISRRIRKNPGKLSVARRKVFAKRSPGISAQIELLENRELLTSIFGYDDLSMSNADVTVVTIGGVTAGPGSPNIDAGYDQINVTNTVQVDGALQIEFVNDFIPEVGDEFDILTYGASTGSFDTAIGLFGFGDGSLYFEVVAQQDRLTLVTRELAGGHGSSFISDSAPADDSLGQFLNQNYFAGVDPSLTVSGTFSVGGFLEMRGTFHFAADVDQSVTLTDGTTKNVSVISVGASGVDAFAGNGPYFVDLNNDGVIDAAPSEDAVGVAITNLDLGLVMMIGSELSSPPDPTTDPAGAVNYAARYLSLTATADSAALVGMGDTVTAELRGLSVEVNLATSPVQNPLFSPEVIDFSQSAGGGLLVETGDLTNPTVMLSSSKEILAARAEDFTLAISDYLYVHGAGLALEKGPDQTVTLADGTTTKEVSVLTIGASNVDAFAGLGPYFIDSNNDGVIDGSDTPSSDAVGLAIENLDLGLAVMQSTDLTAVPTDPQAAVDYVANYIALSATADRAALVGIEDVVTAELLDLTVEVNLATSRLQNQVLHPSAIDFSTLTGGGLSVPTGDSTNPSVLLSSTQEIILASAGQVSLDVAGVIFVDGSLAFSKGATQWVDSALGDPRQVDLLTIGGEDLYGFAGVGGPYRQDTNGDGVIDGSDTVNTNATGLSLEGLTFGMALMRDTIGLNKYVGLKAETDTLQLVGVDGVTAIAENVVVELNEVVPQPNPPTRLDVIDFTSFDGGKLSVETGGANTVDLDFNERLLAASGHLTVNVLDMVELDGVFDFSLSPTQILAYVDGTASVGPADLAMDLDALGLLVIDERGLGLNLDLTGSAEILSVLTVDADLSLRVNTSGQEFVYTVPDKFLSEVDYTTLTITAGAPQPDGSEANPGFYAILDGSGTIGIADTIDIVGDLYFSVTETALQLQTSGTVTDRANLLPASQVAGDILIDSAGLVGSLQVAGGAQTSLFDSGAFSLAGQFQLEVNTTSTAQTIQVLDIAPDGSVVGLKDGSIAANTIRMAGGMSLIVGPFAANGFAELVFSDTGFQVQLDALIDLGGLGSVQVAGQAAIINEASGPIFAANMTMIVALGIPDVGIRGDGNLQINTSTTTAYAGVAADTYLINVDGTVQVLLFEMDANITISSVNGVFRTEFSDLTLNFFNFVDITVNGFVQSDGQFLVSGEGSIGMDMGPLDFSGSVSVSLSDDVISGHLSGSGELDVGLPWPFSEFDLNVGASLDGDIELGIANAYVAFTANFFFSVTIGIDIPFIGEISKTFSENFSFTGDFGWSWGAPPVIARQVGDTVYLNMGVDGGLRGAAYEALTTENYTIDGDGGNITVQSLGQEMSFSGVNRIVATDAGAGNDFIYIGSGVSANVEINGGADNDEITYLGSGTAIINGGAGNDIIRGGQGADTLTGGAGTDRVDGQGGDDLITISGGSDTVLGGQGADQIIVLAGINEIYGGQDDDTIFVHGGTNAVYGETGNDLLSLEFSDVTVGQTTFIGAEENDRVEVAMSSIGSGMQFNDHAFTFNNHTVVFNDTLESFTITDSGATTVIGSTSVAGGQLGTVDLTVNANAIQLNRDLNAANVDFTASNSVTLNDSLTVAESLNVSAGSFSSSINAPVTAGNMTLTTPGAASFGAAVVTTDAMNVSSNSLTAVSSFNAGSATWGVTGAVSLSDSLTVSGSLNISAGSFSSSVNAPVTAGDMTLTTPGAASFGATVVTTGAIDVTSSNLTTGSSVNAGSATWNVTGAVTIEDSLTVAGSLNVSSGSLSSSINSPVTTGDMDLSIQNAVVFGAPVVVTSAMNITSNSLTADQSVTAGSAVWNVTSGVWTKQTVNVSGVIEVNADTVLADQTITGGGLVLHVGHDVELNADLTVLGTMGSGKTGLLEIISSLGQIDFAGQDFHVVNGHLILSAALGFTDTIRSEARALTAINRGTGNRANITVREKDSLNILDAGLVSGGVYSLYGTIDIELAERDSLLTLASGVISAAGIGQDILLVADDMDFHSGANAISGSGVLTIQAISDPSGYTFGTAAEDLNGTPIDFASSLDLDTQDLAALADGFNHLYFGRPADGNTADFGHAIFRDDVTLYADDVTVRGEVEAISPTTDLNGDRFEIFANTLTVDSQHIHTPEGETDSGISAREIVLDIRDRTEINGWLHAASDITLETGSNLFEESLRVGSFGELISRLPGAVIDIASLNDILVAGLIQTVGANASTVITTPSHFELLGGLIESQGVSSTISIQGDEGVDINGRVIAGLTEAGSLSEYDITGSDADVSIVSLQGVRVGGLIASADELTISAGSDATGKSFELDITGLLYTRGEQREVVIDTPDDVEIRGKVFVLGDGSDFIVNSAQRVLVSNDVLADDRIVITAGADSTGVSYEQLTSGTLTTRQGNVEIRGVNDALIHGLITADGAGSDAIIEFGDYVELGNGSAPQTITASDDIIITTSNNTGAPSIFGSLTSTLTTTDAGGNITLSGPGRIDIEGLVQSLGQGSVIDIDAGTEFFLEIGAVIQTELDDSEITVVAPDWVGIYGSIIAGVEIIERTGTIDGNDVFIREYNETGANSNVTVTSGHRLDVPGAITASETMVLSAQDDPSGVSMFIGGQLRTLGANTELVLDAPDAIRIFGNIYVDGENSDLRISSGGQVFIDGWLQVQDQIQISGGVSTAGDGVSVSVTNTGRVESFTVGVHDLTHALQAGNPYQVNITGVNRVDIDGVVKSVGVGGDVSIQAGDRLMINSAVEADDQILLDGGSDPLGVGVLVTTVGGLTSRGTGAGLIEVKSTDDVIVMGHLEARGVGADVLISSEQQVSIGGVTADSQGRNVDVGGFIQASDRIELRGGADTSRTSVKIFAASEVTTSEIDSHIQVDAVNDAQILGVLLAGGEVINEFDGTRRLGRTFAIFGTETYGEESQTSITIHSGNQIVIGLEIHAGRSIEAVGGGDVASGKSIKVFGSARAVTHSEYSTIYLGGTDRIDILGSPHFREIEPAGWATHNDGVLTDAVSFDISLNLGQTIATHTITVGPADAPNGNISDIVNLLQEALDSFDDFKDASGSSWFEVILRNGKILFTTSGLDFSITGGTNAGLLGLTTGTVDAVRPAANLSAIATGSQITLDSAARQLLVADTLPIGDRGILSDDVVLQIMRDVAGIPVSTNVNITRESTLANGNIWGLVDSVQNALDSVGLQDILVRVKDARLTFSSATDFSITDVTNADLLGLSTSTQDSALHTGGKLYLGGFIEAYSGINLLSGKDLVEGNDIEIDWPAVIETIDASIELFAGDEAWIKGDLIAGGSGRDVKLSANRTLKLSGNITASDLIELSAGTDVVAHEISILTENTSRMLAGNATNGDSGRILIHALNDIVIDNAITLTEGTSDLNITSTAGDLFLTEEYGIINTAGFMQLQADVINIDGSISSTADTADEFEVEINATEAVNLNGAVLATGSIHVSASEDVTIVNQLRATGADANVRVDAGDLIELGGEGLDEFGQRFQQGGLIAASNRVDLIAGSDIVLNAATDVLVTQDESVLSLSSGGNIDLIGALHAGAQLDSNNVDWTLPAVNADVQIQATETVQLGGLGIDNSTGGDVPRAGSIQATGMISVLVTGGSAETSLQIGTGSFLRTFGDQADQYEIDIQTDHDVVTTGVLFAEDADADVSVVSGNRVLVAGAIRADDQLVITGGTDESGTSILIAPTVFEDDINGQPEFISGGLLDTSVGGAITLSGSQNIDISGTVGNVYSSGGTDPVPLTNVTEVTITTAETLSVTGLINARDQITVNATDVVVALDGVIATREAGSEIDINATDSVYVLKSGTTENRSLIAARSRIDIDAAYVLVAGTVWGQDDDATIAIHSQQNIDVTGIVDSGDQIEFIAGETDVSGAFVDGADGSIRVTSAGQLLAAGSSAGTDSISLTAATDVEILPVAAEGAGLLNIPNPFVSRTTYEIQEPVGTRRFIGDPATIQVPVTNYFETTFLKEVGTVEVLVGAEYTTIEVDVDQIGYYNPATGQQSELGLAGNPLLNRNGGTNDYSVDGSTTYKQLFQVSYKSGSGQFRTTKDGKDLALVADTATLRTLINAGSIHSSLPSDYTGFVYIEQTDYLNHSGSLSLKEYVPTWSSSQQFEIVSAQEFLGVIWDELPAGERPDWYIKIPVGATDEIKKSVYVSSDALTYEDVGDTWLESDVNLHQIGWWNPATNTGVRDGRTASANAAGFQSGYEKPGAGWEPWYQLEYVSGFRSVQTTDGRSYTYTDTSGAHEGQPVWANSPLLETHYMNGRYVEVPVTANSLGSAHLDIAANWWTGNLTNLDTVVDPNAAKKQFIDARSTTYIPVDAAKAANIANRYVGTFSEWVNVNEWVNSGTFTFTNYTLHEFPDTQYAYFVFDGTTYSTYLSTGAGILTLPNSPTERVWLPYFPGSNPTEIDLENIPATSSPYAAPHQTYTYIGYSGSQNAYSYYDAVSWVPQSASRTWDQVQVDYHWQYQGHIVDAGYWNTVTGYNNDYWVQNLQWENSNLPTYQVPSTVYGNQPTRPNSSYVLVPEFEDRLHYSWHNVYNRHDVLDPRLHLNYQIVSAVSDIYEDRPEYVEVTEQRSKTVLVDKTNWQTETVYAPRLLTDVSEVSDSGRDMNYGVFEQESLLATQGNIHIVAGGQVNVRGIVNALDGSIQIDSIDDTNVGGVLPIGADPATTVAAVAELSATDMITIIAGGNIHIEQAGLVSVNGTSSVGDVALNAAQSVILDGTVTSTHSVSVTAATDVLLQGNLTAGNLVQVVAGTGTTKTGSIFGDIEGIITLNETGGVVTMTAGQLAGDIVLENSDIRGGTAQIDQVTLTAAAGSIVQTGGRQGIVANSLTAVALNGITVNTVIAAADLFVSDIGNIVLTEKDDIDLTHVVTTDGAISVIAFGDVTATDVRTLGTTNASNIALNVLDASGDSDSDLIVKTLQTGLAGVIDLFVQGSVSHVTPSVRVETTELNITATGGIELATDISRLNLRTSGSGHTLINEADEIDLNEVQIQDGSFMITAGGTITATDIQMLSNVDGNDISLTTTVGDIRLGSLNAGFYAATEQEASEGIPTSQGDVNLTAAGSIVLLESGSSEVIVVANEARLTAGGTIDEMNVALNTLAEARIDGIGSLVLHDVDGVGELSPGLQLGTLQTANGSIVIDSGQSLSIGYFDNSGQFHEGRVQADGNTADVRLTSADGSIIAYGRVDGGNVITAGHGIVLHAGRDIVVKGGMNAPELLELRAVGAVGTSEQGGNLSAGTIIIEAGPSIVVEGTWEASELIELISNRGNITITGALQGRNGGSLAKVVLTARGNRITEDGVLFGLFEYQAAGQLYYKESPEPGVGRVFQLAGASLTEVFGTENLDLQPVLGIVAHEVKDELTGLALYEDGTGDIYYRNVGEDRFYSWQAANGRYTFQGISNMTGETELFYKDSPVIGEGAIYYSDNLTLVPASVDLDLFPAFTEITDTDFIGGLTAITDDTTAGTISFDQGVISVRDQLTIQAQAEIAGGNLDLELSGTAGQIDLIAGGNITLDSNVRANQRVSIQSTGYVALDGAAAGGNVTIAGSIQGYDTVVHEIVLGAQKTLTLGSTLIAQDLIELESGNSLNLGVEVTTTAGVGIVRLTSGDGLTTVGSNTVTSNQLETTSVSATSLKTSVAIVDAHVTGSGNLLITEQDSITLEDLVTSNGAITVTAGGTLTAVQVISQTDSDENDISLTTTAGSIAAGEISAGLGVEGDVTLVSANQITDLPGNITADVLSATSAGAMQLDTAVNSLTVNTTAAGEIVITETDAILLNSVQSANGAISVTAGGQIAATSIVSLTDAEENDILLRSTGAGIQVTHVDAGHNFGDVTLDAPNGVITDIGNTVIADELVVSSLSGIQLNTQVNSLDAAVSGAGAITVVEVDSIILTNLTTADGSITVDAGPITVVSIEAGAGGDVSLTSTGAIDEDGAANTMLAGNLLTIRAAGSVTLDTSVTTADVVTSAAGDIDLDELDSITLTQLVTADGSVTVDAGPITVVVIEAGIGGDVSLTSTGSINEDGVANTMISGHLLTVRAAGSVTLDTSVASADIVTSVAGDIDLDEVDAITLTQLVTEHGSITVDAGGSIDATYVVSSTDADDNDILLLSATAGIQVTHVSAGPDFGDVTLDARNGYVTGVGNTLIADVLTIFSLSGIQLNTQVNSLEASVSGTGDIMIVEEDSITLTNLTTADGSTTVDAGEITVVAIDAGQLGNVTLTSASSVNNDGDPDTKITANKLTIMAAGGIDVDTAVAQLCTTTTATGQITVNEVDEITLMNITSFDGAISVTAGGDLTATQVLSLTNSDDNDVSLITTSGSIFIGEITTGSGVDVTLDSAGLIYGLGSTITADELVIRAAGPISLFTTVTSLDAVTTAPGDITITETDDIVLTNIQTFDGSITVNAVGIINAVHVESLTDRVGNDITLTTENGPIYNGYISAGLLGNITASSLSGLIVLDRDVIGDDVTINAAHLVVHVDAVGQLPADGIQYNGTSPDGDNTLELIEGTAHSVIYTFDNLTDGNVNIDGNVIFFANVNSISDLIVADERSFVYPDTANTILLQDDSDTGNRLVRLAQMGSNPELEFLMPISSLTVNAGGGDDNVTVEQLDELNGNGSAFQGTIFINGEAGEDTIDGGLSLYGLRIDGGLDDDLLIGGSGSDLIIGGLGSDTIHASGGKNVVFGDLGEAIYDANGTLLQITTTTSDLGGNDVITTGDGNNIVLGGSGADQITTGAGRDVILGDNGYVLTTGDNGTSGAVQMVRSIDVTLGGNDIVYAGAGNDIVFGGTGNDSLSGGADHDILLGDHGLYDSSLSENQRFLSIETGAADGGGDDLIHGNGGDDFILGQQGNDTIFGDAGDDDITGGHNVEFGADGDDEIHGGDGSDVILGDNGRITRTSLDGFDSEWELYPDPFGDVIRQTTRFDDIDYVFGNDSLFGDLGDDILHGQRGNDQIDGGAGDDELFGELGADTISGGAGNDFILGDVGRIERAYNSDGTPRLNSTGEWHRDVFLEDVGTITGSIDANAQRDNSALLADQLMQADIVLGTGAFDVNGNKVINPDTGAWDTDLLLIDLVSADDDTLDGGDGRDVVFGQRGNDILAGGEGDDLLFGDNATNVLPFWTEIPQIVHGYRLIGVADGVSVELDAGGSVVVPDVLLETSGFDFVDPALTIVSNVVPDFYETAHNDSLRRTDGSLLVPYLATVPDAVHHADAQAGNDTIDGQDGDDLIFGDDASFRAPLASQYKEIRKALDDVTGELVQAQQWLAHLSLDYDLLEHTLLGADHEHDVRVGNDVIDGGSGNDTIVGDQGLVLAFATPDDSSSIDGNGSVEQALAFHAFLRDLEDVVVDLNSVVEESQIQVVEMLMDDAIANNPKQKKNKSRDIIDPDHHDLFFSNDVIQGGAGDDLITGDDAVILMLVLSSDDSHGEYKSQYENDNGELRKEIEKLLEIQQDERESQNNVYFAHHRSDENHQWPKHSKIDLIPYRFDFDTQMSNDTIDGGAGNDVIIGDISIMIMPTVLGSPLSRHESRHLENDIDQLVSDAVKMVDDHRDIDERTDHHSSEDSGEGISRGHDILTGGAGDDIILGDNGVIQPLIQRGGLYNPSLYAVQALKDLGNSDGEWNGGNDIISGGEGNDVLFGQGSADTINGDDGNDLIFGGHNRDNLNGGKGKDTVKQDSGKLSDDDTKLLLQNPWMDLLLENYEDSF